MVNAIAPHNLVDYKGIFQFALEHKLQERLNKMVDRITGKSNQNGYIICHGNVGSGKTNSSIVQASYVHLKTRRPIHLYFKLQGLIEFAKTTERKIIIWDEPAFTSLSTDHASKINKDLLRLINTARLKRHLIIINLTKFWRFPQDVVVDTPQFFIHMNDKEHMKGRFLYIPCARLENLWNDYAKFHERNYWKYKTFGGKMPFIYEKYFDVLNITVEGKKNATYQDYLEFRDQAVSEIGNDTKSNLSGDSKLDELRYKVSQIKGLTREGLAKELGIDSRRLREWSKIQLKDGISLGKQEFKGSAGDMLDTTRVLSMDDDAVSQADDLQGPVTPINKLNPFKEDKQCQP